jgi:hypothetical protein
MFQGTRHTDIGRVSDEGWLRATVLQWVGRDPMVFLSTKEGDDLLIHWTEAATLASMLALASDRIKAALDNSSETSRASITSFGASDTCLSVGELDSVRGDVRDASVLQRPDRRDVGREPIRASHSRFPFIWRSDASAGVFDGYPVSVAGHSI